MRASVEFADFCVHCMCTLLCRDSVQTKTIQVSEMPLTAVGQLLYPGHVVHLATLRKKNVKFSSQLLSKGVDGTGQKLFNDAHSFGSVVASTNMHGPKTYTFHKTEPQHIDPNLVKELDANGVTLDQYKEAFERPEDKPTSKKEDTPAEKTKKRKVAGQSNARVIRLGDTESDSD